MLIRAEQDARLFWHCRGLKGRTGVQSGRKMALRGSVCRPGSARLCYQLCCPHFVISGIAWVACKLLWLGQTPANTMADLVQLLRGYVDRMLRESGPGMKALLLDAETTKIVSTVFSQSELLEQEVFLVERLDADKGDQLFHLKVLLGRPPVHHRRPGWVHTGGAVHALKAWLIQLGHSVCLCM